MTAILPDIHPEARYSTNEVCSIFGVCRLTIGRWVRSGRLRKRIRRANGRPFFLGRDIITFWRGEI